jgi:hypothetical protein
VTDDSGNVTSDSGKLPKIGHDKTECAVTIIQNRRSRSNGMGGHDRAEYALAVNACSIKLAKSSAAATDIEC